MIIGGGKVAERKALTLLNAGASVHIVSPVLRSEALQRLAKSKVLQWTDRKYRPPAIRALQEKSNVIHEETMESLFNKLPELDERQRKVIRRLTKSIVNQMMHDPINRIKEMTGGKQGGEALEYFSQIFALESLIEEKEQEARSNIKKAAAPVKAERIPNAVDQQAEEKPLKVSLAPATL